MTGLHRRLSKALAVGALALTSAAGCGYHFASSGDALPPASETIYVKRFENHTRSTGLNDELDRYIKDEIAMHKRLKVVDDPANADLELTGDIKYTNAVPSNFNSAIEPTLYNNSLAISVALQDVHSKKMIWSARNVGNSQHTPVVAQTVVTTTPTFLQQNLRGGDVAQMTDIETAHSMTFASRDTMMQKVAQNLYAEMAEGF
ncbi:MAG: LPS assembly lipoprotein LptE [Candidatus Binatus sp.]|uniref:LPS assembly lipoprotein LptE n=1 Tax=Candidatus Binatus sp. TaxID=2811406 RepID=UPI00271E50C1|nr:LPS assembly lipoprotein LptE [Candidatus Binatus sp.]MDO8430948.1 LPS assembly lipoprotein LptE [Candidatus Binatus sp.]